MKLDPLLERFAAKAPVSLMLRATLEHAFTPDKLNELFGSVAQQQYTRQLTFDSIVGLLLAVVLRVQPSVHAAYRHGPALNTSITAVYAKLNGVEPMAWLTDVLERIVSRRTKVHELQNLLPWNWRDPSCSDAALAV